jgi:hypothetical protein
MTNGDFFSYNSGWLPVRLSIFAFTATTPTF